MDPLPREPRDLTPAGNGRKMSPMRIPLRLTFLALLLLLAVPALAGEEPATPAPPATIEQAHHRLTALREIPLGGPGSLPRRMERYRAIAQEALAIHAARPATGEDVYRLAEICLEAERFEDAAAFATRYLDAAGKEPPPSLGYAHAVRVRSLARLGKLPEAEAAMKAYREAMPKAEGLSPVSKLLGDALAIAGRLEDALVRYRDAALMLPHPLPSTGAGTWQALAETLVALGRAGEARKAVEDALKDAADPPTQERLRAVLHRIAMAGKPFVPLPFDRWLQGAAPASGSTKEKVVVWHVFAWWMDARAASLADWRKRLEESGEKGLVVFPVTRTGGWDPATKKFEEKRPADAEAADIGKTLEARGWKGAVALYLGEEGFKALEVRGLPMEVVVGRDGLVRMATAGSDAGHALALRAAAAALLEAPPAPPTAPPPPR